MGTSERRERQRLEMRSKILTAARELFVEHGYDAVTMRKIAEKIEYTPTAIYFHFKDKEALTRALCAEDFQAFNETFRPLAKIKDPVERVAKTGEAYIRFGIDHPNHYRWIFMTPHPEHEEDFAEDDGLTADVDR